MHSSCIVVRLDWAAGLPAWLIRSFGSPDLTRKTLFSSQKHQSHRSWDLNEDSWLTLSINIYQFLYIARRYTPSFKVCTWANDRVCPSYAISAILFFFFSRNTVWQKRDNTLNITVMLGSTSHAGWKNSFSVSYCWNWKLEAPVVAHS